VKRKTRQLDYPVIILFVLVAATTLVGVPLFWARYGFTALDWLMFAVLYLISGLGITVGYHRLIAHRSFECPHFIKAAFLVAGGWALENSALRWCADHIRHHARCDEEDDPYNAGRGFWYSHCGWIFEKTPYRDMKYEARLRNDPIIMWQHRNYPLIVLSGLALPFLVGLFNGGWIGGLGCFLLAGVCRIFFVLNSTFCINSICHLWGNQPYGTHDSSRDSWWVSLLTFGEGYHNYHHTHLRDYRNGPNWYNWDPSKWLIFGLSKVGLAFNLQRQRG
jgi:stearoyl-CoA desaturase (delta-9 desaturase)